MLGFLVVVVVLFSASLFYLICFFMTMMIFMLVYLFVWLVESHLELSKKCANSIIAHYFIEYSSFLFGWPIKVSRSQ